MFGKDCTCPEPHLKLRNFLGLRDLFGVVTNGRPDIVPIPFAHQLLWAKAPGKIGQKGWDVARTRAPALKKIPGFTAEPHCPKFNG